MSESNGTGINIDASFHRIMQQLYPRVSTNSNQYRQSRIVWFAAIRWIVELIGTNDVSEEEVLKLFNDLDKQLDEFLKEILSQHKEDRQ